MSYFKKSFTYDDVQHSSVRYKEAAMFYCPLMPLTPLGQELTFSFLTVVVERMALGIWGYFLAIFFPVRRLKLQELNEVNKTGMTEEEVMNSKME